MHVARKRFGQNFLTDPYYINACISAIHPAADELMVEIGPGLGALTNPLLDTLKHLHVVEIDRDIVAKNRIESAFLVFNPDLFPHSRYKMSEVNFELAMLFLYGIVTDKGRKLIEKYTEERIKKLSHEQSA